MSERASTKYTQEMSSEISEEKKHSITSKRMSQNHPEDKSPNNETEEKRHSSISKRTSQSPSEELRSKGLDDEKKYSLMSQRTSQGHSEHQIPKDETEEKRLSLVSKKTSHAPSENLQLKGQNDEKKHSFLSQRTSQGHSEHQMPKDETEERKLSLVSKKTSHAPSVNLQLKGQNDEKKLSFLSQRTSQKDSEEQSPKDENNHSIISKRTSQAPSEDMQLKGTEDEKKFSLLSQKLSQGPSEDHSKPKNEIEDKRLSLTSKRTSQVLSEGLQSAGSEDKMTYSLSAQRTLQRPSRTLPSVSPDEEKNSVMSKRPSQGHSDLPSNLPEEKNKQSLVSERQSNLERERKSEQLIEDQLSIISDDKNLEMQENQQHGQAHRTSAAAMRRHTKESKLSMHSYASMQSKTAIISQIDGLPSIHVVSMEDINQLGSDRVALVTWCIKMGLIDDSKRCQHCNGPARWEVQSDQRLYWICPSDKPNCQLTNVKGKIPFKCKRLTVRMMVKLLFMIYSKYSLNDIMADIKIDEEDYESFKNTVLEACIYSCKKNSGPIGGKNIKVSVETGKRMGFLTPDQTLLAGIEEGDRGKIYFGAFPSANSETRLKQYLEKKILPGSIVKSSTVDEGIIQSMGWNHSDHWTLKYNTGYLAEDLWEQHLIGTTYPFEALAQSIGDYFINYRVTTP